MNINFPNLDDIIKTSENEATVLVLENADAFATTVQNILNNISGVEDSIGIFEDLKEISMKKYADIITDIFSLNINDKKYITKLHNQLNCISMRDEYYSKWIELSSSIARYIELIAFEVDCELQYEDCAVLSILKALSVKFEDQSLNILEKIMLYMNMAVEFFNLKILFLVGIKSVLKNDDIQELYKIARYKKLHLVIIESHFEEKLENEMVFIIDKDGFLLYK